jgi:flagellar L-ring protein precursor FlgH
MSVLGLLLALPCGTADAQTSSLGARQRIAGADQSEERTSREAPPRPRNLVYEKFGWISAPPSLPKTFRPGDLVTIIVREQRQWEADSDLETKKKFDIKSELDAFFKPIDGGLGAANFTRGKPNVDYNFDQKYKSEGDSSREDKLTTRVTARILDVKPNGLLVLEAKASITHDEETSQITVTGTCRKEDVTADNTVLSTQIADKEVKVSNEGALKAAATRGWITKLLDVLKPI